MTNSRIQIHPLTGKSRDDAIALFGERGGYAGCWCMFWRLDRSDFKKLGSEGTKEILHQVAGQKLSSYAGYMGIASVFREVSFVEASPASETQLNMRIPSNRRTSCPSKNQKSNCR